MTLSGVLALVLGPMLETTFRQSLYPNRGDPLVFIQRPISAFFLVALLAVLLLPFLRRLFTRRRPSLPQGEGMRKIDTGPVL